MVGWYNGREKGMCESSPQSGLNLIWFVTWTNTLPVILNHDMDRAQQAPSALNLSLNHQN